jgi:hypothetical protein
MTLRFDPFAAAYDAITESDCLCEGCGRFTCHNPDCGRGSMRECERDNRKTGDLELADMAREAADAEGQDVLAQRMALRRVVRWIEGRVVEEML